MKNVVVRKWFTIPIYAARVLVVVAHDPVLEYNRCVKRTFGGDKTTTFRAMAVTDGNYRFGVFFKSDVDVNSIAHEIKHIVDFIMEWIGAVPPKPKRAGKKTKEALSEPEAYLTGYIHGRVYKILNDNGVKPKPRNAARKETN